MPDAINNASVDRMQLLAQELRGPRYTSYPTALSFDASVGPEQMLVAVAEGNAESSPLSLYVHVPFCASNCFYCGCHRIITRDAKRMDLYVDALLREAAIYAAKVTKTRRVVQLHFGGGTPNSLNALQFGRLMRGLRRLFRFAGVGELEASIEVDPRRASVQDLELWRSLGINRVSFGVQDTNAETQIAINRVQDSAHLASLTQHARAWGYRGINYDLVYGLPLQTLERFEATLDYVIRQAPDRVAAYHYAHLPHRFRAQRAIDSSSLPDLDTRLALRELIERRLTAAGYVAIGMDHFARPDDALARAFAEGTLHRNFQGYSTQAGTDMIGLGASSISFIGGIYAQNEPDIERYQKLVLDRHPATCRGYRLTEDDRIRAAAIQDIMCRGALDFAELRMKVRRRIDFADYFREALDELRELDPAGDWVLVTPAGVTVLDAGRSLLRRVAMAFDAHLHGFATTAYSKVA